MIKEIGLWQFAGISFDNTGNTQKAQELLCKKYPHILNIQDVCHLLNNAIKSICSLSEFEEIKSPIGCFIEIVVLIIDANLGHRTYMEYYWIHEQVELCHGALQLSA